MNKYEQNIYNVVVEIATNVGLEVFSVQEITEGGMKIIQVLVDGPQEIDIDDVTKVIEPLQALIEDSDLIPDDYFLEVSSVGVERPLRNLQEIAMAIDKYIYIELKEAIMNDKEWYGTLKKVEDEILFIEINKKGRIKVVQIPYENLSFARIAIKF